MTSMPASRKARAMTLAPRSCPSSPGLATRTRILKSAIDIHLITVDRTESRHMCSVRDAVKTCVSDGLDIQTSPQIPAGDAAVRFPALGNLLHLRRSRQFDLASRWFLPRRVSFRHTRGTFPPLIQIVLEHRHADSEISGGQHVFALEGEHQKHLRRP